MNWTNWKWDGHNNVYCSCSRCWPVFKRPLKWTWHHRWISEAGTQSHWRRGFVRQNQVHDKQFSR